MSYLGVTPSFQTVSNYGETLVDDADAAAARTTLGLGTAATQATGIGTGNVAAFAAGIADDDFLRINGTTVEGLSAAETMTQLGAAALAGATFTGEITANGGINEDHNNGVLSNSNQTLTLDCHNGNNFSVTTAANITSFVVSNLPASGTAFFFTLKVTYGGSHAITWGSAVKWNAGTAPTLSTSGTDLFAFYTVDAGTTIYGFTAGQALA